MDVFSPMFDPGGVALLLIQGLLVMSLWCAVTILDRLTGALRVWLHSRRFRAQAGPLLAGRRWKDVTEAARDRRWHLSPQARVIASGAKAWLAQREAGTPAELAWHVAREAMWNVRDRCLAEGQKGQTALLVIAVGAPLVGLTDFVYELAAGLRMLAIIGASGAQVAALAMGLSSALIPCGWGLVLAVPSFGAWAWLAARARRVRRDLDETVFELLSQLARPGDGAGA